MGGRLRAATTSMSGYSLAPGISFCNTGGRHIFLDIRVDRYFCLGPAADRGFARLVAGAPLEAADRMHLSALQRQGLLMPVDGCGLSSISAACTSVRRSLLDEMTSPPSLDMLKAAAALLHARWSLRLRSLDRLLSYARSVKADLPPFDLARDEGRLAAIAAAFQKAALLTGALNQCLANSLAISRQARAHGIATDLVLGVKLRPFQAHAWVQAGEVLVSDPVDRVAPFTPILVI